MTFEEFATNHEQHAHCLGCGGCLLNPNVERSSTTPVWCTGCTVRIAKNLPAGVMPPWGYAPVLYSQEAVDAHCAHMAKGLTP